MTAISGQRPDTGLFDVVIMGWHLGDTQALHDRDRRAVDDTPFPGLNLAVVL